MNVIEKIDSSVVVLGRPFVPLDSAKVGLIFAVTMDFRVFRFKYWRQHMKNATNPENTFRICRTTVFLW